MSCKQTILLLILVWQIQQPCRGETTEASEAEANVISPGDVPFLVLVEVNLPSGRIYINGCLASLSWVLTFSESLAQMDHGDVKDPESILVHAGLTSLDHIGQTPSRSAITIVNGAKSNTDEDFSDLVLIKLNSSFEGSNKIKTMAFNVGEINHFQDHTLVGWAHNHDSEETLPQAVSLKIVTRSNDFCKEWSLVQAPQQICTYQWPVQPIRLNDGAVLLVKGFPTALKQLDTNYKWKDSSTVSIFVWLRNFVPWMKRIVTDPDPDTVFVEDNSEETQITETRKNSGSNKASWSRATVILLLFSYIDYCFL